MWSKSDPFPQLVLIGIVCSIPTEIFTLIAKKFNLTTISACEAYSMVFMRKPSWILGLFVLPSLAVIGVVSFYYVVSKVMGIEHLVAKMIMYAMVFTAVIWEVFGTIIGNQNMMQDAIGNYVFSFSGGLAGFVAGILLKKYVYRGS